VRSLLASYDDAKSVCMLGMSWKGLFASRDDDESLFGEFYDEEESVGQLWSLPHWGRGVFEGVQMS
jgi:hypothetical protein